MAEPCNNNSDLNAVIFCGVLIQYLICKEHAINKKCQVCFHSRISEEGSIELGKKTFGSFHSYMTGDSQSSTVHASNSVPTAELITTSKQS